MHTTEPYAPAGTDLQLAAIVEGSALLDDVLDAVIMTDRAFRIVRWNKGACALYGWDEADALGRPLNEIVPTLRYLEGGTRDDAVRDLQQNLHWRGGVVQRHRDGRELFVDGSVRMLRDVNAQPLGAIAVNRDISERLKLFERERATRAEAEAAKHRLEVIARASRAFAEANLALDNVLTVIVTQVAHLVGDSCVLRLLSDDGSELLPGFGAHWIPEAQWTVEQVLARHPRPSNEGIMGRAITSGEPLIIPHVPPGLISASGIAAVATFFEKFPIHSVLAVPLRAHDQIIGALALSRDQTPNPFTDDDLTLAVEIAERAALAIENARLYEASQAAIKVRESFLSIAAHELRTPLTSLLGHVTRLARGARRGAPLSERDQRSLAAMTSQGKRINGLIEEMLDVSRLQLGRFHLAQAVVDIGALVRQVLQEQPHIVEHYQIELDLPAEPILLQGDPQRLEQVVTNVLGNAVKYSAVGGQLAVRLAADEHEVTLAVTDQGVGIPAGDLPNLFTQFFRASNVDPQRVSGLGIGLFLARAIVAQHGGEIAVESVEDVGSTFRIRLPRAAEIGPAAESTPDTQRVP